MFYVKEYIMYYLVFAFNQFRGLPCGLHGNLRQIYRHYQFIIYWPFILIPRRPAGHQPMLLYTDAGRLSYGARPDIDRCYYIQTPVGCNSSLDALVRPDVGYLYLEYLHFVLYWHGVSC